MSSRKKCLLNSKMFIIAVLLGSSDTYTVFTVISRRNVQFAQLSYLHVKRHNFNINLTH